MIEIITSAESGPDGVARWVRLVVRDTGCGMSDDVLQRAIDPFFSTKGVGQGTGLGLSMVYGAVNALGGSTRLTSTAGVGTQVTIDLPAALD